MPSQSPCRRGQNLLYSACYPGQKALDKQERASRLHDSCCQYVLLVSLCWFHLAARLLAPRTCHSVCMIENKYIGIYHWANTIRFVKSNVQVGPLPADQTQISRANACRSGPNRAPVRASGCVSALGCKWTQAPRRNLIQSRRGLVAPSVHPHLPHCHLHLFEIRPPVMQTI